MKFMCVFLIFLAACSRSDEDRIGEAQHCLDKANPSEAQACVQPILHLNTQAAQMVKCSAGFTTEGFKDGQKFLKAYRQLEDPNQGSPGFLGTMTFSSKATPQENRRFSREVDGYCQFSGQWFFNMLGAMSLAATTISEGGGLQWSATNPPDRNEIRRAITVLQATRFNPQTIAAIREVGSTVLRMYEVSCQQTEARLPQLCDQMRSALSTSGANKDTETAGDRILDLWRQ